MNLKEQKINDLVNRIQGKLFYCLEEQVYCIAVFRQNGYDIAEVNIERLFNIAVMYSNAFQVNLSSVTCKMMSRKEWNQNAIIYYAYNQQLNELGCKEVESMNAILRQSPFSGGAR